MTTESPASPLLRMMQHMFYARTGQLRPVWRLLIFAGSAYSATVLLNAVVWLSMGGPRFGWQAATISLSTLSVAILFAHWLSVRVVDRRGWDFVGLHRGALRPKTLAAAALIGALAIGMPTALLLMARQFAIVPAEGGSWPQATFRTTMVLIPAALWEELMFRGYSLAVLREAIGWKWALFITSMMFGVVHLSNTGANPINILIVVLAGYLLGLVWLSTQSLYAAWIAHLAWNWVMGCLFHVSVSGNPFERPGYEMVEQGPDWLTGGVWGPEGGIAAAVGLFAAVFYVYGRYRTQLRMQLRRTQLATEPLGSATIAPALADGRLGIK